MRVRSLAANSAALAAVVLLAACGASPIPASTSPSATAGQPTATGSVAAWGTATAAASPTLSVQEFSVPAGSHPHDVAPGPDGGVWYTAQAAGKLGWLDPASGQIKEIDLGNGSAPHGVIVGPDGAPWITDGGLNAVLRVDPGSSDIRRSTLSKSALNLNTAAFDGKGVLWFTGQAGFIGQVDETTVPATTAVYEAPRGPGPYGITGTPSGAVYFASLAGSYLGLIDRPTGNVTVLEPPTSNAGVRRAWSDSRGRIWVSEWNVGQVGVYDPANGAWREWKLPGESPLAYAVFVDDHDIVWLTDFGADAIVRFDPATETFTTVDLPTHPAEVRQLNGRSGEVWGAESAADKLVVVRTGS